MKRVPAILLLLILLFNFCGYRFVLSHLNDLATTAIEKQADAKDYADNELVSVKTKLNLAYYTGSNEFERAYGSININGQDYEYVKRRVHNDTLELLCLPNYAKTKLKAAGNELAKASADGNASVPSKKSTTILKISLPDFYQTFSIQLSYSFALLRANRHSADNTDVVVGYSRIQERPPQVA